MIIIIIIIISKRIFYLPTYLSVCLSNYLIIPYSSSYSSFPYFSRRPCWLKGWPLRWASMDSAVLLCLAFKGRSSGKTQCWNLFQTVSVAIPSQEAVRSPKLPPISYSPSNHELPYKSPNTRRQRGWSPTGGYRRYPNAEMSHLSSHAILEFYAEGVWK